MASARCVQAGPAPLLDRVMMIGVSIFLSRKHATLHELTLRWTEIVQLTHSLMLVDNQAKPLSGQDHPSTVDEHSSNEVLFHEQM